MGTKVEKETVINVHGTMDVITPLPYNLIVMVKNDDGRLEAEKQILTNDEKEVKKFYNQLDVRHRRCYVLDMKTFMYEEYDEEGCQDDIYQLNLIEFHEIITEIMEAFTPVYQEEMGKLHQMIKRH